MGIFKSRVEFSTFTVTIIWVLGNLFWLALVYNRPDLTIPVLIGAACLNGAWIVQLWRSRHTPFNNAYQRPAEGLHLALYQISEATSITHNLQDLFERMHSIIGNLLPAKNFYIALYNGNTDTISFPYSIDEDLSPVKDIKFNHHTPTLGLTNYILLTGTPLLVTPEKLNELITSGEVYTVGRNPDAWLGVPLKTREGRTIGALAVQSYTSGIRYRESDIEILTFVSTQIAMAIEHKQAEEDIKKQLQRLSALQIIDKAITSTVESNHVLGTILQQTTNELGVEAASILLLNRTTNFLEYAANKGFRTQALKHTRLELGEGFAGKAALSREIIHISDLRVELSKLSSAPLIEEEGFVTYFGVPLIAREQVIGVLEIFDRKLIFPDDEWMAFLQALAGQAAIALDNAILFVESNNANTQLSLAYDDTIQGWARALEMRDVETKGHSQRVTDMTLVMAISLGMRGKDLVNIRRGSILHDIGKMGIPDSILLKPGPLLPEEWETMHKHPVYALDMLSTIEFLHPVLNIPYCHHERWDGSGYPRGLKGEQIPLSARIFSIVDVWDSLMHERPYKKAWSEGETLDYLKQKSGSHFDPRVVDLFMETIK